MKLTSIIELDAIALEKNYIVVEELDSATGWSAGAADAVNFRTGGAGLKITATVSATVTSSKTLGTAINLAGFSLTDQVRFWVYIDNIANLNQIQIKFVDSQGSPVTAILTRTTGQLVQGWNRISLAKSTFTNYATIMWSSIITLSLVVTASAGGTVNATFDMWRLMVGPSIGYTVGVWDETTGVADVVDHKIKFFDAGYWQLTNADIVPTDWYRLDDTSLATVVVGTGTVRISGINQMIQLLEIFAADFTGKDRLILFQPDYYSTSQIMDNIRTAQGYQTGRLMVQMMDSFRQTFAQWATNQLVVHERETGVGAADSANFSLAKRRDRVKAQYEVAHLPMNIVGMRRLVEHFVDIASVTHNPAAYFFQVQIVSPKGIPSNLTEIQNAIEKAKPAHLGYTITYTFTTWNTMDGYNRPWNTAESFTWSGFEVS